MKEQDTVIRFTGIGGQGILFAGKMLAEAALSAGIHPCFAPSYGAEKRGGPSECTVILSHGELPSPCVSRSHAAVVMNGASFSREEQRLAAGGIIVVNSSVCGDVKLSREDLSLFLVPASELAEKLRNDRVANVVITGALVELLGAHVGIQLSQEHLVQGLKRTLAGKEDLLAVNMEALARGQEYARTLKA
ncbi:MAG: 2-oxoacid:ferredoxin oxidoreductase subunit gamma [Firmicutes bacterium]|jgi:2-oxoglutarate ferredoxin oxidoreductase subunit gamma|nr:2-oxoacid:ferredoxin oxidoreductase subunit gamma [Bacillota bacterium]